MNDYKYDGPLNGGYAIQDPQITWELRDFCESTYEWKEFFAADGITDHSEKFLTTFNRWIRKTRLNVIKGLDAFLMLHKQTELAKHSRCFYNVTVTRILNFLKVIL